MPTKLFSQLAVAALPDAWGGLVLARGSILHLRVHNAKKAVATWYSIFGDGHHLSQAHQNFHTHERYTDEVYEVWDSPLTAFLPDALLHRVLPRYIGNGHYLRRVRKHQFHLGPILRRRLKESWTCDIYRD